MDAKDYKAWSRRKMNRLTKVWFPIAFLAVVAFAADAPKTAQASKEDLYHLRAVNAELNTIDMQLRQYADQLHVGDKVKEKNELLAKICGPAGIPIDKCNVDPDGKVTKAPDPPKGK
jgi:hypothetical protein